MYDRDVTICGRPISCSFVYERNKIKLVLLRPGPTSETKQTEPSSSKRALTLISPKLIDKEIAKGSTVVALVAREVINDSQEQIPLAVVSILREFADVFTEKLPDSLPCMRDIQHAIDLVLGLFFPTCLTTE